MTVRKDWTLKQAQAAQKRFEAGGGRRFHPHRPYAQWEALHELDALQNQFASGDRYALATALRICANRALPMPAWVAAAYIKGYDAVNCLSATSWDVLFGPVIPKGKQLESLRRRSENWGAVWHEVQRRHAAGESIDDELFEDIGQKLGIGATTAKEWYRSEKHHYDTMLKAWDQPGHPIGDVFRPYRERTKK